MPLLYLLLLLQAPAFQATASQGDGSQCTATKNAGANVNLTFSCVNPIRGLPSETHRIYNAGGLQPRQPGGQVVTFGDIACMFVVNPTAATIAVGSLTVPPTSLWYTCSLNVRTAGKVTGDTLGPAGIIAWP